jgi:hypothetical protein
VPNTNNPTGPTSAASIMSAAEAHKLFASVVAEAVVDLFKDYGLTLRPTPADVAVDKRVPDLISLAKFEGRDLSGCLVLGATNELIALSGRAAGIDGNAKTDWIAELANQLLGRVKNHALRAGIGFGVVPPAVVDGKHLRPVVDQPDFQPTFLSCEEGVVCLWIELRTAAHVEIDVDLAGSVLVSESDVLMF